MTERQHNLSLILDLQKDGIDKVAMIEEIEKIMDSEQKTSYNEGVQKGVQKGKDDTETSKTLINCSGVVASVIGIGLLLSWILTSFAGCSTAEAKAEQIHQNNLAQQQTDIQSVIKACSDGDYTTCRAGWLKYNTSDFKKDVGDSTHYVWVNPTCQSFEEAYYNKTNKALIMDPSAEYFSH